MLPSILAVVVTGNPVLVHEAIIDVSLDGPAAIAVECTLDADSTEVHLVESPRAVSHQVRINGLLADEDYTCAVALTSPRAPARTTTFTFTTPAARYRAPLMEVARDESLAMTGGDYTIFNHQRWCDGDTTQRLFIVDPEARVRWQYEIPVGMDMGVEARPNADGNIVWGGGNTPQSATEIVSLSGEVLYKVDFPRAWRTAFHHDGKQIDSGEILTLEYAFNNNSAGENWRGFSLRTFDPTTGEETWEWKSQYGYDQGVLPAGAGDVYHANWVDIHEEADGPTAYVSLCLRYQVLAVDVATKNVKWLFGPGGDFTLQNRDGEPLSDRFYSSCQHGIEVADGNRILMYDNGWVRGQSRAVEYELDHAAGTATLMWSWTEDGWYETILGDADWLPEDHVLLDQAHMECGSSSPGRPNQIVEIDKATGGVPWRLTMPHLNDCSYRAERIASCTLFTNAKYCAQTRERLGELAGAFGR